MTLATKTNKSFLRRFMANESGVAIIEMAFAFPIVLWLTVAILELGVIFHLSSLANFAATEASRKGKTGNLYGFSGTREQLIRTTIADTLGPWMGINNIEVDIDLRSYGAFDNLQFSTAGPGLASAGGGNELVLYLAQVRWPFLTPMFATLMNSNFAVIQVNVLAKNERF